MRCDEHSTNRLCSKQTEEEHEEDEVCKKNNSSLLFLFVFYCFCFLSPLLLLIYKTKGLARSDKNCDYALYLAICLWLWCFFAALVLHHVVVVVAVVFVFFIVVGWCLRFLISISKFQCKGIFILFFLLIDRRRDRKKFAFDVVFLCFFCV